MYLEHPLTAALTRENPWVLPIPRGYQLALVFTIPLMVAFMLWKGLIGPGFVSAHSVCLTLDIVGVVNAGYLSLVALKGAKMLPSMYRPVLEKVNASGYHKFFGIPNAYLGLGTYMAMAVVSGAGILLPEYEAICCQAVLALSSVGFIFSLRLMRAMFLKIRHVCPFCVVSAGTMTTVWLLSVFAR